MLEKQKLKLSPSRVKTYMSCSLLYWYSYKGHNNGECGMPQTSNDGARRGGAVHAVLECLSNPKRRQRVEEMVFQKDPWVDKAVKRLAYNLAKKDGVHEGENFELIRKFILAALSEDFYCEGADSVEIERKFHIEEDEFISNGFIDKAAIFGNRVKIIDYKTSKKKFTKDELTFNLQNFFYTQAAQNLWPGKEISFDFQFLKFAPNITVPAPKITEKEMDGFSEWLREVARSIDAITFDSAKMNTPKDKGPGYNWLCGKKDLFAKKTDGSGEDAWCCSFRRPFIYFSLVRNGKTIKTDHERENLEKVKLDGDKIEQHSHKGCHAWRQELKSLNRT